MSGIDGPADEYTRKEIAAAVIRKSDLGGWDRNNLISLMEDAYYFVKNGKREETIKKPGSIL